MMRLLAILFALGLSTPAVARIDPSSFGSLSFRQHPGGQLPLDAQFRDGSGRVVTLASAIGGRPSIVIMEYLRCQNLCNLVINGATEALVRGQLTPGKQVNLIAISIDPRDTTTDAAAAAAMYARRFSDPATAANGIHFLTGAPSQVKRVASAVGFPYRFDQQSGQYAHPGGFVIVTPEGRISRYVLGLNPPSGEVSKAIATAADGVVEPPAYPLLCLCFGYDPDEGTVAALTWRIAQVGSTVVALACIALIASLAFRRRSA